MTAVANVGAGAGAGAGAGVGAESGAGTESGSSSVYGVLGMSCGHCSAAVTEALTALSGVKAVEIDLAGKRAVVSSDAPLDVAVVRDAIEGAGYQLV